MKSLYLIIYESLFLICAFWHLEYLECKEPPLFVSLGSHCEVTAQIANNQLRSVAFPFDWNLTLDHQGFLKILEENFSDFTNPHYFESFPKYLINSRYNIDLCHDWFDGDFDQYFPQIQAKYARRIQRFNNLKEYKGKVYFIRAAFDLTLNSSCPTITSECTRIGYPHAVKLRDIISQKFPELDCVVVVINYVEEGTADIPYIDGVLEYKVRKTHRLEDYKNLFFLLLLDSNK